jgi:hypothetical protein
LGLVVQFAFKLGYLLWVELDYVKTKTLSLSVSQKFWRRPNLREWLVGIKISGRMVMQLHYKGFSIAANKPTKNNSRSLAGNFRISNLEGFMRLAVSYPDSDTKTILALKTDPPGSAVSTYS